ncbi:MAG TPA: NAD(P)-binding domain-containing protein [Kineosporiaceae bacterium]|nr:NAD(P)-binding domain-containing protein [Kineosporiaceae bacterium]
MVETAGEVNTIGLIGAGRIGSTLARLFVGTGRDVVVSNSRRPETLADLVAELGPHAWAATPTEAALAADLAVVSIPLKAFREVPVDPLADVIVVDTDNYYAARDGRIPELDDESTTVSELLQAHLPTSQVVKAFNTIPWGHLATHGTPPGTPGRQALPIAGDDTTAKAVVAGLIDEIGFDVVDAGPLAEGWRFQRGTWAYVVRLDRDELADALARAKRYRDLTPVEAREIAARTQAGLAS